MSKRPMLMDGEWFYPRRKGFELECCDCGLVHRFNFKLVDVPHGKAIKFQAVRDARATAQTRRQRRAKGKK